MEMSKIAVTEEILEGRCHACSSSLKIEEIQGTEKFLEEYLSLNTDAKILCWEDALLNGADGAVTYLCEKCKKMYTVMHRFGSHQQELTYQRGTGQNRYYEHWVLLETIIEGSK